MAHNNGSTWRKVLLVLAMGLLAALSLVTIAPARSSADAAITEQSDSKGGNVVKAAEPRYCEGPADADRGSIEHAEWSDDAESAEGDIQRAPNPGYCERSVDAGQGDVELRN